MYNLQELIFLDNNIDKTFLVFAYGQTKTGMRDNYIINKNKNRSLGQEFKTIRNYTLYNMGDYCLMSNLDNPEFPVKGEVFEVDAHTLLELDKYYNTMERVKIQVIDDSLIKPDEFSILEVETYMFDIKLNNIKILPDINNTLVWKG